MRMGVFLVYVAILFGAFTISSSTSSPSNQELFVGFLSYNDAAKSNRGTSTTLCCGDESLGVCHEPCQLVFEASLHDGRGIGIVTRRRLATTSLVKGVAGDGAHYVDADDITKPVAFDVPDKIVDVNLHVRIYKNVAKGDSKAMEASQGVTLEEVIHLLDVHQDSTDFFYLVDIPGKQRPNATLHIAVRFSCKGGGCLTDCVQRPWLQHCTGLQERKNQSKQKYIGNPLARCPYPSVIPSVKPTPSSSQLPTKSTDSTPNTTTTTTTMSATGAITTTTSSMETQQTTQVLSSMPASTSTSTSMSSSSSYSSLTPTAFSTTLTTTITSSTSQHSDMTSTPQQLQSTNTFTPADTESSQTPPISPSQTKTTESTSPSSSMTNTDIPTTSKLIESSIQTSWSFLQTSLLTIDPSSSLLQFSSTQSETESTTNQMHSTPSNISPTSTRKSCTCTRTKTPNHASTMNSISSSVSTVMDTTHTPSSSPHQPLTSTKTPELTSSNITPTPTITPQQQTITTISSLHSPTHPSSSTTTQTMSSSSTPVSTNHDNTQQTTTSSRKPTINDGSSTTIKTQRATQSGQPPISPQTTQSPFLPVESSEDDEDPMAYWAIIVGSVLGGLAVVGIIGYFLYRSRQTSLRKHQELYTVTPQIISTIEDNGTAGRSDVPMTTALL